MKPHKWGKSPKFIFNGKEKRLFHAKTNISESFSEACSDLRSDNKRYFDTPKIKK